MFRAKPSLLFFLFVFYISLLTTNAAFAAPASFVDLIKTAGPAVVNISTERTEKIRSSRFRNMPRFPGFEENHEFFNDFSREHPQIRKRTSLGSGFIISTDGYIVTNNHVVQNADTITVTMEEKQKEKTYSATIVGTDPDTDLAVLKIEATNLPTLEFGDSDTLEVGAWVIAIGNPLGLDHSVTAGILSAKGRRIQSGSYDDFLQTDASINPGNSGGPLLNMAGEVIGINTAIANRAQGIGFAIPSTMAKKIITDLRNHRKVSRGWLGITIQNIDSATAKALALPTTKGVLISQVLEGQPASTAGIKAGDVLLSIAGEKIEHTDMLLRKVALITPGTTVKISIWRDGAQKDLSITVSEKDSQASLKDAPHTEPDKVTTASSRLGITVRPLSSTEISRLGGSSSAGLFITEVTRSGLAVSAGIQPNDIIIAVGKKAVHNTSELADAINKSAQNTGAVLLHIIRNNNSFFIAIDMADKE